jgi:hypothetical protein
MEIGWEYGAHVETINKYTKWLKKLGRIRGRYG